jgi:Na+-translocating ferredoxin:NAD+ oxidoreductase RnfG subunit
MVFPGLLSAQAPEGQLQSQAVKLFDIPVVLEKANFPDSVRISLQEDDQVFLLRAASDGKIVGYAWASSALGRYEKFDYFFLTDKNASILLVKVWQYRSTHGGAIAGKRWLKQFIGYTGGAIEYGKDIQAISGATLSGNSIVHDIERAQDILAVAREMHME